MQPSRHVVGMIGGMSWESSALYYRLLNQGFKKRFGGHHNARSLMFSVDYDEMLAFAEQDDWEGVARALSDAAKRLEMAGASLVLMASNTAHMVADQVSAAINIPLLHIAEPTSAAIKRAGVSKVGLIGTRFTMEMNFFVEALQKEGIVVNLPDLADRKLLHAIIVEELTLGIVSPESRLVAEAIMDRLLTRGAEGIVLGCTEIPLLLNEADYKFPLFNTTQLHVNAAIERMSVSPVTVSGSLVQGLLIGHSSSA